jgi:hypothetical protein
MAACILAKDEVRVQFPLRAPKFDVGNSSSGKTTVSEAVNLSSILRFPASASEMLVGACETSNLVDRVQLPTGAPNLDVGDSSSGRTAVFEAAYGSSILSSPAKCPRGPIGRGVALRTQRLSVRIRPRAPSLNVGRQTSLEWSPGLEPGETVSLRGFKSHPPDQKLRALAQSGQRICFGSRGSSVRIRDARPR